LAANGEGRSDLEVINTLNESIDAYVGDVYTGRTARTFLGTAGPPITPPTPIDIRCIPALR
jgi:hypothetical protein